MRIGIGKKNNSGGFTFEISIPFLEPCSLDIAKVENPKDKQPHWYVYFQGERCGALWRRTPRAGGDDFLSGQIESPLFPGQELPIAIFNSEVPGQKNMTWRPRGDSQDRAPEAKPAQKETVAAAVSEDDDIPF